MDELIFLKLGGSLLTDKTRPRALRPEVLARLAREIAAALRARPGLRLLIGHGSGSFGHVTAQRYGTRQGVTTAEGWRGYAETAATAAELNRLVTEALWEAGVPALPVQPSASACCWDGELRTLDDRPFHVSLAHGLVPLTYGDVALDEVRGGTIISTEQIFRWLAPRLQPHRIVLAGEVEGVYTAHQLAGQPGQLIRTLTPDDLPTLQAGLAGSRGVDVTGGMVAKVAEMVALVQEVPSLAVVQIVSGLVPDLVRAVLIGQESRAGTRIVRAQEGASW
jgi:isopentenyl phosphate kinase